MSETIKNDYFERIEKAVIFIEDNLRNELTSDLIAEKACFSKYHFIRVFSSMIGETVGNYVRKRRISKSAKDLITTDLSILDLAIIYQFESQESYTRSFKRVYNTTPGKYRKHGINQIAFGRSKLSDNRLKHLKSNIMMKPDIIEISEKKLVGMRIKTSLFDNKIPELWQKFMPRMNEIQNDKNTGCYELHPYDLDFKPENFSEKMKFEKWAIVEVSNFDNVPEGMETHILKAGQYAVFIHKGLMSKVQMSFDYVYGTWLPNSEFELDTRDDFERYGEKYFCPENSESETEIWIPIKKRNF